MLNGTQLLLLSLGLLAALASGITFNASEIQQVRPKRSDDISPLQTVVDDHSQQLSAILARLTALETRMSTAETNVAFHAYHSTDPFNVASQGTIVYDTTITNIGNAYDTRSGIFSAPVSGTYLLLITCMAQRGTTEEPNVLLEGRTVARCHSNMLTEGTYEQASSFAIIGMQAGQQAWVRLRENAEDVRGGYWNTFAGFLLHASAA